MQVIILGMHRSGTSLMGSILTALGINMGDEALAKNIFNVDGYYEDPKLVDINKNIFEDTCHSWDNPPECSYLENNKTTYSEWLAEYVKSRQADWGAKDPKLCFTAKFLHPHLSDPYYIVCTRSKEGVAKSLYMRDLMPISQGKLLREKYLVAIDDFFSKNPSVKRIDIEYEVLLDSPDVQVEGLCQFLSLTCSDSEKRLAIERVRDTQSLKNEKLIRWKEEVLKPYLRWFLIKPYRIFRKRGIRRLKLLYINYRALKNP